MDLGQVAKNTGANLARAPTELIGVQSLKSSDKPVFWEIIYGVFGGPQREAGFQL
jgi:hypothetical protein